MKKSRFSEEQIVRILKEVEAGAKVAETGRKHVVSEATFYKWKTKFAGLESRNCSISKACKPSCHG
jgi:putative transposase